MNQPERTVKNFLHRNNGWNRFIQYIERKYEVDLKPLNSGQTMTGQNWTDNEEKIRKDFNWALGPGPLHTMTTVEYDERPEDMDLKKLLEIFKMYYIPKRNIYHNRGDFFWMKQKKGETPEELWTRLVEVERECEFETLKKGDLLISKFIAALEEDDLRDKILKEKKIEIRTVMI